MHLIRIFWFLIALFEAIPALAAMHGGSGGGVAPTCPFGVGLGDGCGVSPGVYFAPAVNNTTSPTPAQWGAYARQSGQTWLADHPQNWNLAGVDYGVGPNALISTLADIASWPAGQNQCTYFADGSGHGITSWPVGWPLLLCIGSTQADFTISGYNFGPTAYQGSPVGNHDCVNMVIKPSNGTTYTPHITLTKDAIINGPTCAPLISGVHYGIVSSVTGFRGLLTAWNNYIDGRINDVGGCCLPSTNQGFWLATNSEAASVDQEFNYVINMGSAPSLTNFSTGNESAFPCTNGTAYTTAGYVNTNKYNYYDGFGQVYGAGHWEITTMGLAAATTMCAVYNQYNTVVWSNTAASEGTTTFFGNTLNTGLIELFMVDHNTVVTNLIGGAHYPNVIEYYNWHTDGGTPNQIIIDGLGSSCSGQCTGPRKGQYITQGNGGGAPTGTFQIGLRVLNSGSGVGSAWGGGCNIASVNATYVMCTNGTDPNLNPGVAVPPVTNTVFDNRVVSVAGASAQHGQAGIGYDVVQMTNNFIDGMASGAGFGSTLGQAYWSVQPNAGGPSNCAVPATVSGNLELTSGAAINTYAGAGAQGC